MAALLSKSSQLSGKKFSCRENSPTLLKCREDRDFLKNGTMWNLKFLLFKHVLRSFSYVVNFDVFFFKQEKNNIFVKKSCRFYIVKMIFFQKNVRIFLIFTNFQSCEMVWNQVIFFCFSRKNNIFFKKSCRFYIVKITFFWKM